MLKKLIEFVVKQLVEQPETVLVTEEQNDQKVIVSVRVAPQDLKRVIGKEGRVIRAIRAMANCVDPRGDKEIKLDISE